MINKILSILICGVITCGAGYMGTLPDLNSEFDYKRDIPKTSAPIFDPTQNPSNSELKPIPRNDKSYLEIIIKKDKTPEYTNDVNDVITTLEKLKSCIESNNDIQNFNAIVSNVIDNIQFIQEKYTNKPESAYMSYRSMIKFSNEARKVAILRTQAQVYTKYLPYTTTGAQYRPSNVKAQISKLGKSVNQTLYVLKNLD